MDLIEKINVIVNEIQTNRKSMFKKSYILIGQDKEIMAEILEIDRQIEIPFQEFSGAVEILKERFEKIKNTHRQ